jgi:hypothetical protein
MPASQRPALSLTIWNASSTDYTLKIMTVGGRHLHAASCWPTRVVDVLGVPQAQISDAGEGSLDLPGEGQKPGGDGRSLNRPGSVRAAGSRDPAAL